jgi:hypothetical protein
MFAIRFKSVFIAITLVLFLSSCLIADEKDNFLEAMKKSNVNAKSIINKNRISFSILTNANPLSPKQELVLKQCIASWQGDTLSMHIVYSYINPPAYYPSEQRIDYNKDGALIIWRTVEKYIQSSPIRNEVLEKSKRFYAYPDGSIKEGNDTTFHYIYPIGKPDSIVEYSHFELVLGKGISQQLKSIYSIEQDSSGKNVKIRAKGLLGEGLEGNWRLLVDPNSDYLIREAEFSADVNGTPLCQVSSSGTISTKDGVAFASKGTLLFGKILQTSVVDVNIVSMNDNDCNDFHQIISKQLDMPMTPGTQIWDFRGKIPNSSIVK